MINQLIIILTDKQQAELIKRAEAENYDDDLEYLQLHLNDWLKETKEMPDIIGDALAREINDRKRLDHTEK